MSSGQEYSDRRDEEQTPIGYQKQVSLALWKSMNIPPLEAAALWEIYERTPQLEDPNLSFSYFETPQEIEQIADRFDFANYLMRGAGKPSHTMYESAEAILKSNLTRIHLKKSLKGFAMQQANSYTVNQNSKVVEEVRRPKRKFFGLGGIKE